MAVACVTPQSKQIEAKTLWAFRWLLHKGFKRLAIMEKLRIGRSTFYRYARHVRLTKDDP